MSTAVSRRSLLRGEGLFGEPRKGMAAQVSEPSVAFMPPWSVADYLEKCSGCGDCVEACEEGVLRLKPVAHDKQVAELTFDKSGCSFCEACADSCSTGAIDRARPGPALFWTAKVGGRCLALSAVHCRACDDSCEPRAIRFPLIAGRVSPPILNDEACTGCGFCLSACPVGAITLSRSGA